MRTCARAGELRVAYLALLAAEAELERYGESEGEEISVHPSAYAALQTAAQEALSATTSAAVDQAGAGALSTAAGAGRDEAASILEALASRGSSAGGGSAGASEGRGSRGLVRLQSSGVGGAGSIASGGSSSSTTSSSSPAPSTKPVGPEPSASFVLEGAQVVCGHGENSSSPVDIFLTKGDSGEVSGTVDIAREARSLVYRLQRRRLYTPILSSLPPSRRVLSESRQRRVLSQQAEKKALAAQLALGYPEARMTLTHRMGADSHAFFKAASLATQTRIVVQDQRVKHTFENGVCSCADAAYRGSQS